MKPKVAFFDFASCEGCQLQIANLEEQIIDVLDVVDIVAFREIMTDDSESYDIAFVEGSITRPIDEKRIKKIRKNAKILVALGACAHLGGVQKLGNQWTSKENLKHVYPQASSMVISDSNPFFEKPKQKALDEVVKVDFILPGCPIDKGEFVKLVSALLHGKKPSIPDYSVCVECKKAENECLFTIGKFCMGPLARAGCGAICPTYGNECEACRGYVSHPHENAHFAVLEKYGLDPDEILHRKTMFTYRYHEKKDQNKKEEAK
ncbi:NADH:ubiquinone oxidoreductase [Thermoplasmatales archaeon ex4572_165]|nr:MAG: NADH:ubiquinone oxidoreductase [Thermoplasmatales archaeon ex4572_165]RLF59093.1 MAG: NADH:ubiquinone oxidoreductase [Thermoplasmata archaeon]